MIGMYLSQVIQIPKDFDGPVYELGEPLLFKAAAWLTFGPVPDGYTVNMHPVAFAAWFGMLATTLNLFPVGQTDGGHVSYAVLGRFSTFVSFATLACLMGLSFISLSWIVWTVLMTAMLSSSDRDTLEPSTTMYHSIDLESGLPRLPWRCSSSAFRRSPPSWWISSRAVNDTGIRTRRVAWKSHLLTRCSADRYRR